MYFMVSWDVPDASWDEHNKRMKACFASRLHAHPLSTFYLVQVPNEQVYFAIRTEMQRLADSGNGINFFSVLVPSSAPRGGWLNKEEWAKIEEVTR